MGVMPKRNSTLVQFGRNVAHLRNDAGLSQDKLAEKADLDRTYAIRERRFKEGPRTKREGNLRCGTCDFLGLCGMECAVAHKRANSHSS
jgi:radical SAM protein with 4Fe4S-binding SPASM domain